MKTYNYKGYTIVLIESLNGVEKWYNIFKNDIKINDNRDINTLTKAKQYINELQG